MSNSDVIDDGDRREVIFLDTSSESEDGEGEFIFHDTSSESEDGEGEIIFYDTSSESEGPEDGERQIIFHNTSCKSEEDGERESTFHNPSSEEIGSASTSRPIPTFDVKAYSKFRNFLNTLEKEMRRVEIKEGKTPPTVSDYTSDVFEKLMFQTYGPLDKTHSSYDQLRVEYFLAKSEQIQTWTKEEENPAYLEPPSRLKQILDEIVSTYSHEQILSFNLNPYTNHARADYFNLHRVKARFEDFKFVGMDKAGQDLNFATFDPYFEILFYGWATDNTGRYDIPPKSREALGKVLSRFPLGVAPTIFFGERGIGQLPYEMDYRKWSPEFTDGFTFCEIVDDIAWYRENRDMSGVSGLLLFPPYLEGSVATLDEISQRLWKRIKLLLTLSDGFLRVESIPDLHRKIFAEDFPLNPQDWLLAGMPELIRVLSSKWPDPAIEMLPYISGERVEGPQGMTTISEMYLIRVTQEDTFLKNKYEEIQEQIKTSARLTKEKQMAETESEAEEIPKECVQWNFSCPTISDEILKGSYLRCLGGEITSPFRFYVNLAESWNHLEAFMKHLKEEFEARHKLPWVKKSWTPNLFSLIPGQHVMAYYQKEWHRGQIVSCNRDPEDRFLVKMIDYGTETYLPKNEIKYMLQEYLTVFPVQAIECQLKFNRDIPKDFKWNREAIEHFTELLVNKVLGVTFHERIPFSQESKRNQSVWSWSVSVHIMEGSDASLCDPTFKFKGPTDSNENKKHYGELITSIRDFDISKQFLKYFPLHNSQIPVKTRDQ